MQEENWMKKTKIYRIRSTQIKVPCGIQAINGKNQSGMGRTCNKNGC